MTPRANRSPVAAPGTVDGAPAAPVPGMHLARLLRGWSIRTRLMALVLALGVPFLAFVAGDAMHQASVEREVMAQRSLGAARMIASRVDDVITDMESLLLLVAVAPVAGERETQAYLVTLHVHLRGYIDDVSIWTPQGRLVAALAPTDGSSEEAVMRTALHTRAFAVHAPARNARGEYLLQFARPVLRPNGEIAAVVVASVRTRDLRRLVDPSGLLPGPALVTLVDSDGLVVARSRDPEQWVGKYVPSRDVRQHAAAVEGVFEDTGIDGQRRIYGFATPVRVGWMVYLGTPADEALAPIRHRMLAVLVPGVAALLAGLALAASIGTGFVRALRALAQDASRLTDGDLDHRSTVRGADEINVLAQTLNRMAASLQERGAAVAHSREELSRVTSNVPVLIAYIDAAQRFRFANEYYRDVFGVPPSRLVGRSLQKLFAGADYARLAPHLDEVLRGYPVSFETSFAASGEDRWFLVSCFPDYSDDRTVSGFYAVCQDITARREAEAALAARERFTQQVTDTVPARITYLGIDGRLQFGNAPFARTWPAAANGFLGKPILDLVPPAAAAQLAPHLARALAGEAQSFEIDVEVNGTVRHDLVHYVPDRDDQGGVRGVFTISQDVTALKRSESARLDSERRVRLIADNVPAAMAYVNRHERYLFCNAAFSAAFGRPLDELIGMRAADTLPPDAYAVTRPYIQAVLRGERQRFQRVLTRDGARRQQLVEYIPEVDASGETSGFFALIHDITDLHDAQARVEASEQRLRRMTESVPSLLCYIDGDLHYRFNSRYYEEWLGRPLAEITGRRVLDVLGPATYALDEPYMMRALAGERVEFELSHTDARGTRYVRCSYVPDLDAGGRVLGIYGATTDITSMKRVEKELERLAQFDSLTGLPNRNQFNVRIADALARARRAGLGVGLLFVDIDGFKRINDTLGHAAGDEVLREFGRRLTTAVRDTDTVARLGGDEFVVVLEGIHRRDECLFIARKIVGAMQRPFHVGASALDVTTSIGIALSEDASVAPETLLQRADAALYDAKAQGRNRYEVAG